ncbi:MAG: glycosyltransferase family 9 protein [Ginsengibacter sp.]
MQKILIIQTAFIGDVVLATALVEKLHIYFPEVAIDFLVRKGNESLLDNNPLINEVIVWDKKINKNKNLLRLVGKTIAAKYDKVINLQRFFSTGLLTTLSGAKETIGFTKNPLSWLFSRRVKHEIDLENPKHEVNRNHALIAHFTDDVTALPKLYPSVKDHQVIKPYLNDSFITITPSSVWFTKKYPVEKWKDFIDQIDPLFKIYLLGGKENVEEANDLATNSANKNVEVLAGKLSFLQSAELMKYAKMNYVNDSAPLHFASAVNAPVTAIFCSTVPKFGFTPLSNISHVVETTVKLECRPCGLHGYKACPLSHFKCAYTITTDQLLYTLNNG